MIDPGGTPLPPSSRATAEQDVARRVAQGEKGLPLQEWATTRVEPALRPDGSLVYVAANHAVEGLDDDTAAPAPAEPATGADNDAEIAADPVPYVEPVDYRPTGSVTVPSGLKARAQANIDALRVAHLCAEQNRAATPDEQEVLVQWSGWGALPGMFADDHDVLADERAGLRELLDEKTWRAARASTVNAHYTDPAIARQMWEAVTAAGFTDGRVLEPGCGSGNFLGFAPEKAVTVGVELDPTTAQIAHLLYPSAQIRPEGFEKTRLPDGAFALSIGNVPFGAFEVPDPIYNSGRHHIHNYFIHKSLALTAPGGYVAVLTSKGTMDAGGPKARAARQAIHDKADLVGAVRLPTGAFRRVAGTEVVTDVLIFRRRELDLPVPAEPAWLDTVDLPVRDRDGEQVDLPINRYFVDHPQNVLGQLRADRGLYREGELTVSSSSSPEQVSVELGARLRQIVTDAKDRGHGLTANADSLRAAEVTTTAGLATSADLTRDAGEMPIGRLRWNAAADTFERRGLGGIEPVALPKSRVTETRHLLQLREVAELAITTQRSTSATAADKEANRRELNKLYDSYVAKYGPINRFKVQGGRERTEEEQQTRFAKLEAEWRERNSDEQGWSYAGDLPERVADDLLDKSWAATPRSTRQTHLDALRGDPSITALLALERYEVDEDAGTVKVSKAQIFTRDVVAPPVKVTRADSPDQALSIVLAESPEHINLDRVAELRGLNSAEEAREDLGNLVYTDIDDPTELTTATRLLSGDMRAKVDRAREQLGADPGNAGLVQSLEAITAKVPETLEAARIKVKISAPWISTSDYEQFATEVFGADRTTIDHHHDGTYSVQCFNSPDTATMRSEFGADNSDRTKALSAIDLYQMLLNQQSIKVENSSEAVKERGLPRIDMQATTLAQVQAGKINDEFRRWLWEDPDRKGRLVEEYNRRFNTLVPTTYDGSFLQLDGVSEAFTPHPYQRDAVARIVAEPSALLDHVVGAGKTGSMFMGAMELRRRGLVRQPWIVVPTHLIEQMGREAKQWYPAAQILVGWKAMNEDARKLFVAQSAASDWDFVIIPSSVFEKISVHPERRSEYIQQQLDELDRAEPTTTAGIKRVEKAKNTLKAKLEKALTEANKTKAIVHFEESGCDYLLVDEAHLYKNLSRQCALEELALENGSAKADDLALKLQLLRDRQQDQARAEGRSLEPGTERVATFATGTPIANSMSEMWVMQQFLRPDLLRHAGVRSLTAWAGTFTTSASLILPNISGTKLQVVEKIAKFNNPDQLAQMSSIFADVVTRDQVPVPLPSIASGKRKVITTEPGIDVKDFIADFAHRVETADPRRPDLDNQLKVLSDGRNVALDPRLANLDPDPGNTRADAVAREVARIYHANSDREYEDPEGGMSPVRGATQIVFCDRGTPKKGQWSVYQGLRDSLTELGIPPEKVAFIHDAVKPSARLKLQADVRAGRVAVLIGSTEKMGTGLNVQDRLVALHHMDVPWRPADLEQREGRIIRQGNQNSEIELLTYVTTGTTDTVMWSKVETKAGYIAQMKRGGTGMDEIEDVGEITLAEEASAAKAAASGDPRFMRVAELDNESKRLEALAAAHQDSRSHARWVVNRNTKAIPARQKQLDVIVPLAEGAPAWAESGKPITVFIGGQPKSFAERKDRGMALLHACRAGYRAAKTGMDSVEVAQFPSGVSVRANRRFFDSALVLSMYAADKTMLGVSVELPSAKLWPKAEGNENGLAAKAASDGQVASGLLTRLENAYADHLPDRIPWLQRELDGLAAEIEIQEPRIDAPFPDQEALNATRVELVQLRMDIEADKSTPEAIAAAQEADERMRRNGRYPGWSLDLNPTPTLVEESGMEDKAAYVTAAIENMRQRAQDYAAEHDVDHQPELVASGGRALPVKALQPAQNSRTTRRATGNRAERPTGPAGRDEGGNELGR
ncbi:helicase-related protein [Tsukamurella columbiensis]|uniref:Helicase n=1 Tax=Tsukamurella columbiensis TaxID=128509 RepID=A0ABX1LMX4_9ACTN|nr:helicase-related protein [Tsukamurella columbiensis]NMD58313.1 helicase [Tsukamurella columbiensis]